MSGTHGADPRGRDKRISGGPCAAGQPAPKELAFKETPVGVEPTQNRFAGGRLPVWLRRRFGFDSAKSVLARIRTWSSTFAESRAIHHTPRTIETFGDQYPAEDSNLVRQLRGLLCVPGTPAGRISTATSRSTRRLTPSARLEHELPSDPASRPRELAGASFLLQMSRPGIEPGPGPSEGPMRSVTPSRQSHSARARGVEPREAVLEAAGSPGSTLVECPRTGVRGLSFSFEETQLSSGTFQYASLMNFDQLIIRSLVRA
jgi:hypothetical protein